MSGFVLINIESGHLSIHYSVPDDGRGRGVEGLHQGDAGSRKLSLIRFDSYQEHILKCSLHIFTCLNNSGQYSITDFDNKKS